MDTLKLASRKYRWRRRLVLALATTSLLLLGNGGTSWSRIVNSQVQDIDGGYETEMKKGLDLLRRHRYEEALKSFKHANELRDRKCAVCFYDMALACQGLQAYKNVIENCDKAIEFAANDTELISQAYNLKGVALQSQAESKDQKKQQEAEGVFRQGLALNTELPVLHYNLGVTLLRQSRDAEGIAELKKYIQLQPDGSDAETASKMIENPRRAREAYAPDFSVTTSDGEYIALDDLRGKVVLLDFWGTWCPPCVASVPSLRDMHKRYAKEKSFVMISVSVHDEEDKWRGFIFKNQMDWSQFRDRDGKMQRAFRVDRFPTYILIDFEGIVRLRVSGLSFEREAALNEAIHKQIKIVAKSGPAE
jgi:thiol-disulfide isomerase/thioredoxin